MSLENNISGSGGAGGPSLSGSSAWLDAYNVSGCVGVGQYHTVAFGDNSNVIAFGGNKVGQLGIGKGKSMSTKPEHVKDSRNLASVSQASSWKSVPLQVSCGSLHTALLVSSGELYTWGFTDSGRLGLGDEGDTTGDAVYFPARVPRFTVDRYCAFVACGADHTLCIDTNGDVWSWGVGNYGNLGHGSNRNESEPRIVEALFGKVVRMVAGGAKHSACVTRKGELYTWGHGDKGRLGNGAQRGTSTPELVTAISQCFSVYVACGEAHTACVSDAGELFTWGAGSYGRLGHGEESDLFVPIKVESLTRTQVVMVSLGVFHSVCVTKDGQMYTWGGGQYGKLGLGNDSNVLSPTLVPTNYFDGCAILQAFAGPSHTIAVTSAGSMYSWGDSVQGKLGHGGLERTNIPRLVALEKGMHGLRIAPPHASTVAGSLGMSGDSAPKLSPGSGEITSAAIRAVSVGAKHSLAVSFGGALFAWGSNEFGQIGNGTRTEVRSPVKVKLSSTLSHRVISIAAGSNHSMCCITQGDVYAWGRGNEAQIGTGSTITEVLPVLIQGLQGQRITAVYAGETHSAALSDNGELYTWGDPDMGKLGHGRSLTDSDPQFDTVSLPRMVKGVLSKRKVVQASLGTSHTACIDSNGRCYTWGAGWQGKLGIGSTDNQYLPQAVISLQFQVVKQVSCGAYHTLFVTNDGDLYVCGRGDSRLGLGDTDDKTVPELNSTLRSNAAFVIQAAAGEEHSVVLTNDGRLWSWGKDTYGKLGTSASSKSSTSSTVLSSGVRVQSTPEPLESNVINLSNDRYRNQEDIKMISVRSNHCLALGQDGQVYAWGSNGSGRLGLGSREGQQSYVSPLPVTRFIKRHEDTTLASSNVAQKRVNRVDEDEDEGNEDGLNTSVVAGGLGLVGAVTATAGGGEGADQRELESHIRNYMETNKAPPLYVIQLFLKAEPKQRQESGIRMDLQQLLAAEANLYETFVALVSAEDEVQRLDYSIGLTIASTIRKLNIPGTAGDASFHGGNKSKSKRKKTKKKKTPSTSAMSVGAVGSRGTLSKALLAKIPSYEFVFRILLANPRYMLSMYKLYAKEQRVQQQRPDEGGVTSSGALENAIHASNGAELPNLLGEWRNLYFELVESLYVFGDAHCDHLFLVLARAILRDEIESFMDSSLNSVTAATRTGASDFYSNSEADMAAGGFGTGDDPVANVTRVGNSSEIRRSLKRFLHPKMQCGSFLHLAQSYFAQPSLANWLRKHFEVVISDLFRGQNSRTQAGEELNLTHDPVKIYNELKGNQAESLVGDAERANLLRSEYASYPDVKREIENRLDRLRETTLSFINEIINGIATIPMEVRLLCKILHDELSKAFPPESGATPIEFDQTIAKFLVDYLFRPAFLSPQRRHILPRHFGSLGQQQKRNMVQIIGFMQAIVSERLYTEDWLKGLNVVIRQNRGRVQAMVNNLLSIPTNLSDALFTDVFTEYLRPKEDLLNLQVSTRTLKFVRFALNHDTSSAICSNLDPLYRAAHDEGTGGILSTPLDRAAANGFVKEYQHLKEESNVKVNLEVELRFLDIEPPTEAATQDSILTPGLHTTLAAPRKSLRDGLRIDPISQVPLPLWMVEHEEELAPKVEEIMSSMVFDENEGDEANRILQSELVELPELSPDCGLAELVVALEKRLDEFVRDGEYGRAEKLHTAIQKLNEISISHSDNDGFDHLLRGFLTSLVQRKDAAVRLNHQLSSCKSLEKRASSRLKELEEQREELQDYMKYIGSGGTIEKSSSAPVLGSRHSSAAVNSSRIVQKAHKSSSVSRFSSKSTANIKKLKNELSKRGANIGSYGKFTLRQLLDRGVVIPIVEGNNAGDDSGMSPDVFLKNKTAIKFIFTSTSAGVYHVAVVLGEDAILDQFQIAMSKLAHFERVVKTIYTPSTLPFNFGVSQLKILLEETTMKQLLGTGSSN